jgi:hypothetical protein
MNNSVVFAGFAATNLATRIVDAQAKLVTTGMQRCAQADRSSRVEGKRLGDRTTF